MFLPRACACSGCSHFSSVALIIRLFIGGKVIVHFILVLFLHLQLQGGRQLSSQGWSKTCSRQCKRKGKTLDTNWAMPIFGQPYNELIRTRGCIRPLKVSNWWWSSVLDVELTLGRPPWLLFRLAASSAWLPPCCNTERNHCQGRKKTFSGDDA